MGVPVDGLSTVGYTHMNNWGDLCVDLLGHRPPNREVDANKNTAVMEGPRVKDKWLEDQISNPFPADAIEELVQQYVVYGLWRTSLNYVFAIFQSNQQQKEL